MTATEAGRDHDSCPRRFTITGKRPYATEVQTAQVRSAFAGHRRWVYSLPAGAKCGGTFRPHGPQGPMPKSLESGRGLASSSPHQATARRLPTISTSNTQKQPNFALPSIMWFGIQNTDEQDAFLGAFRSCDDPGMCSHESAHPEQREPGPAP